MAVYFEQAYVERLVGDLSIFLRYGFGFTFLDIY